MYSCRDFYKQWHLSLDLLDCKDLTVDLVVRQAWRPIVLLLFGFKVPVQTKQIYCINAKLVLIFNWCTALLEKTCWLVEHTALLYCMYVLVYKKTIVLLRCFNILANSMSNNCGVKSRQWYFYVRSCEIVQIFSFACFSFPLRFYENVNLQIVSQTAFWVFIICLWPPCLYNYVTEYCATCWISKVANGEQVIVTIGDVMKHLAWHSRASTKGNTRARIFSHQQMGFTVLNPIYQGWEFALCFFERIAGFFVTERAIRSW